MIINKKFLASLVLIAVLGFTSACGNNKTEEQRMADATAAFEAGQYRAALIELKNLLQDNPKSKDARVLLAETSLNIGDADAAAKELERAGQLGATVDEIYALQQSTWLKLGKYQELIDNYSPEKSSDENERYEMQLVYAKALNGLNKTEDARAQYQSLVDSGGDASWKAEGLVGLALIARGAGNDDRAEMLAGQAIEANANSTSAYISLGQIGISRAEFAKAHDYFVAGLKTTGVDDGQRFVLLSGELEAALGKTDFEAAKDAANRLFTLAPKHPITSYLLARVAYASGDKDLAYEKIQQVLSEFPGFLPAQFLQGAMALERKEYPQAEMFLSNVVAAQPNNYEARKMLAEANLRLDNVAAAAEILREGIRLGPGQDQLKSLLGRVNLRLDNSSENVEQLEKMLEENGGDEQTRLTLIAAYVAAGRAADALALIESGDTESVNPERKAVVKMIAAIQAKDRQAASAQADMIVATWPQNPRIHNMIGIWFMSEGMAVKSRTTFENSYAINPDSAELLLSLARVDSQEGKLDDAEARFEDFLKRNPANQDAWLAMVATYANSGQDAKAMDALQRTRTALPDAFLPDVVLTRLLLSKRQIKEATEIAERLANNHKNVAMAQFMYGRVLFENNQYELALEYLKKADSLKAGQTETLGYKARTQLRMKRFAQAKLSYQALWEASPGNIEAAQTIILLEQRNGNTAAAREMLEKLRELRPDDPRVDIVDADLKAERGLNKAAFELYEKIYTQRPSRDLALKLARLAEGQGADPESFIRRWLEQSPDDMAARLVLAQSLQEGGRGKDAITEYEAIISTRPDDGLALNNLAWLHFENGGQNSQQRALELSKRAYSASPGSAQVADTYGWILFKTGQVKEGLEVLALADAKARNQGLNDVRDITYHYAAALSESGDRGGARVRLKSILSDERPFYSRDDAQLLLDSLSR